MSHPPTAPTPTTGPPKELTDEEKAIAKIEKRKRTRIKLAQEIMTTEETYVDQLNQVVDLYITPLMSLASNNDTAVLTLEECRTLFSNIAVLAQLNQNFLKDIKARVENYDPDTSIMSDLFISFAPFFKMYTQYVGNHDNATNFLLKLNKSNTAWQKFQTKVSLDERHKAPSLATYFITPIQRIPRYKLLLDELRKQSPSDHPDYENLAKASQIVGTVAKHINESMHSASARRKLIDIQENFTTNLTLVGAGRVFIKHGPLVKQCRRDDRKYEFFLFSDMLIYASITASGKYKLHQKLSVNEFFLVQDIPDSPSKENQIKILSQQKSFIVYSTTPNEKIQWLEAFVNCMNTAQKRIGVNANRKSHVAPVWQSDSASDTCTNCNGGFSLFNRRHHCRHCGGLVCGSCSKKRMRITEPGQQKSAEQRVCDNCVNNIEKQQIKKTSLCTATAENNHNCDNDGKKDGNVNILSSIGEDEELQEDNNDSEDDEEEEEGGEIVTAAEIRRLSTAVQPPIKEDYKFIGTCKGTFKYDADATNDLSFEQGDIINIISKPDSGWWTGELNGNVGDFPCTYVVEIGPDSEVKEIEQQECVEATEDFNPSKNDNDDCMSYNKNDIIVISQKEDGWWYGLNTRSNITGWFVPDHTKPYTGAIPIPTNDKNDATSAITTSVESVNVDSSSSLKVEEEVAKEEIIKEEPKEIIKEEPKEIIKEEPEEPEEPKKEEKHGSLKRLPDINATKNKFSTDLKTVTEVSTVKVDVKPIIGDLDAGKGKCGSCDCLSFTPNMFKKNQCRDCRHAKVSHSF